MALSYQFQQLHSNIPSSAPFHLTPSSQIIKTLLILIQQKNSAEIKEQMGDSMFICGIQYLATEWCQITQYLCIVIITSYLIPMILVYNRLVGFQMLLVNNRSVRFRMLQVNNIILVIFPMLLVNNRLVIFPMLLVNNRLVRFPIRCLKSNSHNSTNRSIYHYSHIRYCHHFHEMAKLTLLLKTKQV